MSFAVFLIWLFVLIGRPQDFFIALVPLRLALSFALLTAAAAVVSKKKTSLRMLLRLEESRKYMLFFLVMILGIPFAIYRREAFTTIFGLYLSNILFFIFFLVYVDSLKRLKTVLFTITICTLMYSGFSLTKGVF